MLVFEFSGILEGFYFRGGQIVELDRLGSLFFYNFKIWVF